MKIAVGCLLLLATLVQCRYMSRTYRRTFGFGSSYRTGATDKCSGVIGPDLKAYEECQIFVTGGADCEELYSAMNSDFKPRRVAAGHLLDLNHCEPPLSYRTSAVPVCGQSPALRQREPFMNGPRQMGRIVGGEKAMNCTVVPWQAQIFDGLEECGGSIISERHILTAAHCFHVIRKDPQFLKVMAGIYRRYHQNDWEQKVKVIDVAVPDTYNRRINNDIAILTLEKPLEFNECVAPVCLDSAFTPDGHECIVSGWGDLEYRWEGSLDLMMAKVETFDGPKCEDQFQIKDMRGYVEARETVLCAGYIEGGVDACSGDSGGPLACWHNDHYVQVGVVSHGNKCATPNEPGFYSKVNYHKDWIQEVTGIQF